MRGRSRQFGVPLLSLFFALWFGACSGSQQDEEGLEVQNEEQGEQNSEQGEEEQQSNEEGQQEAAQGEDSGQYAEEGGEEEGGEEVAAEGEGDAVAEEGNATENDLQEIIQEMNGTGGDTAAAGGAVPMTDTTAMATDSSAGMAPAPVESAAAPVAAAAPAIGFQPGGTPAGPGLPEMGSKMPYIVQPGDTLAKISQKIYGQVSRWKEMASLSGLANPSRIYPGDLVYYTLEDASLAFATAYEKTTRSEEQVQPGDTLATIAQRVYGSPNSWKAIWRQNDNIGNPDIVKPGSTVFYIATANLSAELKKQQAYFKSLAAEKAKNLGKTISAEVSAPVKGVTTGITSVIMADGRLFHKAIDSVQFQI